MARKHDLPDFRSPAFLLAHIEHTLAFYEGRCLDPSGGFFHFYKDDGTVYDRRTRHLVSSTRFVFNHAMAYRRFGGAARQAAVRHGLAFLHTAHAQPHGGYAWQIDWHHGRATVQDGTNHCYGLAFVLLAHAQALMAGVPEAAAGLQATWQLLEQRFWEPAHGLYADEASASWQLGPYRGQNANMHACEALLAAHAATGEPHYLQRALTLAESVTQRLASRCGGLVWEHYRADWTPDWDYHRDDPGHLFRPWGHQTGHLTEWAKLLLQLEARLLRTGERAADTTPQPLPTAGPATDAALQLQAQPQALPPSPSQPPLAPAWLLPTARHFFDTALRLGWDAAHGGLVYGFGPDHRVCDGHKYFWVQAESLAAAAWLAVRTGEAAYWAAYEQLWLYSWHHMIDHVHGAWYRILTPDNRRLSDEKSPAGKTDYHTMGACCDVLQALGA